MHGEQHGREHEQDIRQADRTETIGDAQQIEAGDGQRHGHEHQHADAPAQEHEGQQRHHHDVHGGQESRTAGRFAVQNAILLQGAGGEQHDAADHGNDHRVGEQSRHGRIGLVRIQLGTGDGNDVGCTVRCGICGDGHGCLGPNDIGPGCIALIRAPPATHPQQNRHQRQCSQREARGVEEHRRHRIHALDLRHERKTPDQRGQQQAQHAYEFLSFHGEPA